jgi:hypothetical protein
VKTVEFVGRKNGRRKTAEKISTQEIFGAKKNEKSSLQNFELKNNCTKNNTEQ